MTCNFSPRANKIGLFLLQQNLDLICAENQWLSLVGTGRKWIRVHPIGRRRIAPKGLTNLGRSKKYLDNIKAIKPG